MEEGKQPEDIKVDTTLSDMKPFGAKWMIVAHDYCCVLFNELFEEVYY